MGKQRSENILMDFQAVAMKVQEMIKFSEDIKEISQMSF